MAATSTVEAPDDPEGIGAAEIDGTFVPRRRDGIASVEIDGETVLLDERTRASHLLNPTATVVWSCFDGTADLDTLIGELADAYGIEADVVRDDVLNLARDVGGKGLLHGVAPTVHVPPSPTSLPIGDPVPGFELPALDGGTVTLDELHGRAVLLLNWSPRCGFCDRIAPDMIELRHDLAAAGVEVVLVAFGEEQANRDKVEDLGLPFRVALQQEQPLELFAGLGTPAAYLLDGDGAVAAPLAVGALDVPVLARQAAGVAPSEPSEGTDHSDHDHHRH